MQEDFIFGAGTGKTYQDIKRMRDIAEQFGRGVSGSPRTGMDGLHAIADALISRTNTRKADREQAKLMEQLGPNNPIITSLMGIPQYAVPKYRYGTDFHPGGPAIVGEDGPELLMLPKGAKVQPNPATIAQTPGLVPEQIGPQGDLSGMVQTAEAKGETATDAMPKLDLNVTEAQRTGQALRLLQAEATLRELEESQGTRGGQKALEWLPDFVENYAVDEDYGKYQIARDAFVEAAMRADTGATINVEEWPRILKNITVQPGDGPERIAQRRAMRETILKGLMAASGEGQTLMPEIGKHVVPIQNMSDDDLLKALGGGN